MFIDEYVFIIVSATHDRLLWNKNLVREAHNILVKLTAIYYIWCVVATDFAFRNS